MTWKTFGTPRRQHLLTGQPNTWTPSDKTLLQARCGLLVQDSKARHETDAPPCQACLTGVI